MSEHEMTTEVAEPQARGAGVVAQFEGEKALLAEYVYALRSKVDRVNRYKVARL